MFKYIKLGKILKQVIEKGKQLKTVLYSSNQIKQSQIPMAYSILSLVINNFNAIKCAQQEITVKGKANINNPYLMLIMIAQFINTGKIVGGGQLKRIILDHQHLVPSIQKQSKINKQTVQIRLRQNSSNFSQHLQKLESIGHKDSLIPNMFHFQQQVYSNLTKNKQIDILNSPSCMMQSFSSALPPYLLLKGVKEKWRNRKYDVIDACSAPGNKTVQLAEYNQRGKIFAFQKSDKRFQLLKKTISKYEASNIVAKNANFLQVQATTKFKKVKFILLDPSCSGSGMLTNFTRDHNNADSMNEASFKQFCESRYQELSPSEKKRIENLHNFQVELLEHAVKVFQPLRISYSTCSIFRRENQDVVQRFLQGHKEYKIKLYKLNEGSELISDGFGQKFKGCIRVDPRKMKTDGFFVTVFTRSREAG